MAQGVAHLILDKVMARPSVDERCGRSVHYVAFRNVDPLHSCAPLICVIDGMPHYRHLVQARRADPDRMGATEWASRFNYLRFGLLRRQKAVILSSDKSLRVGLRQLCDARRESLNLHF